MKGKLSTFHKVYITVVAVMLVLLAVASVVLWSVLDAYEKTRPKHAAEQVFEKYFVSMNLGELYEKYSPETLLFDSRASIDKMVKETISPESLRYFSVAVNEDGSQQYAVASDKKRIAYFTVAMSDKKAGYGFRYYQLSDVEFFLPSYGDISVKVETGDILKINGNVVDPKYIVEKGIESAVNKHMPEGVEGVTYDKYTVKGLLFEPEITVATADGKAKTVKLDSTDNCYVEQPIYSAELENEHKDYVITAIEQYTKFLSNDGSFGGFSGYLDKNYPIYGLVKVIDVVWVRDHSGYSITEQKAGEFIEYADGVFSCRVSMLETLRRPGYADHKEHIDVTIYLHKVGNKYLIYDMVNN